MLSLVTVEIDVICRLLLCDSLSVGSTMCACVLLYAYTLCICPYVKDWGALTTHVHERGSAKCSTSCVSGSVSTAVARHRAGRQADSAEVCGSPKAHEINGLFSPVLNPTPSHS